jgi:hypothetical protein
MGQCAKADDTWTKDWREAHHLQRYGKYGMAECVKERKREFKKMQNAKPLSNCFSYLNICQHYRIILGCMG